MALFEISARLTSQYIDVEPFREELPLAPWELPDPRDVDHLVRSGRAAELPFKVWFAETGIGSKRGGMIHAGGAHMIVSERFLEVLRRLDVSDFSTYPIDLLDSHGNPIPGYVGFAVEPDADGDIQAIPAGGYSFLATARVADALRAARLGLQIREFTGAEDGWTAEELEAAMAEAEEVSRSEAAAEADRLASGNRERYFELCARDSFEHVVVEANWAGRDDEYSTQPPDVADLLADGRADEIPFKVWFAQVNRGTRTEDLLFAGDGPKLASRRFVEALEEHRATGWTTYDAEVLDWQGQPIEGYVGFAVSPGTDAGEIRNYDGVAQYSFLASERVTRALADAGLDFAVGQYPPETFQPASLPVPREAASEPSGLFRLHASYADSHLWVEPRWDGIDDSGYWLLPDGRDISEVVAEGQLDEIPFEVWFRAFGSGTKRGDLLWTGGLAQKFASQRFVEVLQGLGVTGYITYDLAIVDKKGNPIEGYVGFATAPTSDDDEIRPLFGRQGFTFLASERVVDALRAAGALDGVVVEPHDPNDFGE